MDATNDSAVDETILSPNSSWKMHQPSVSSTTSCSLNNTYNQFNENNYRNAILKLSHKFNQLASNQLSPLLSIPDGYLTQKFVRKAIKEQLGVKLSVAEINTLCYKLQEHSVNEIVGLHGNISDDSTLLFEGKTVKALIVRVSKLVTKKMPLTTKITPTSAV